MELILKYFPDITPKQTEQFLQLKDLYIAWNEKINVISRKDIDELYLRHVLHSLAIAKFCKFEIESNVLDVGTGGGFPGIPLAIMFPESQFVLVDSIGKKLRVVEDVAGSIGLKNVTVIHERAEHLPEKFDYVVSRAVTRLETFWQWIHKSFNSTLPKNGGLYALKGGDLAEEIEELETKYSNTTVQQFEISEFFQEDFFETKSLLKVQLKVLPST